jgi:hypothetical protein
MEPRTGESYGSPEAWGEPVPVYRQASQLMDIVGAHTDIVGLTRHRYRIIHGLLSQAQWHSGAIRQL